MNDTRIKLISDSFNNSYHTFGYAYIFDKKSTNYKFLSKILKILGILIPAVIGFTVLSFYQNKQLSEILIYIGVVISISQFGLSIVALINGWDEELTYSLESSTDHNILYDKFKNLAKYPPLDDNDLKVRFDLIETEFRSRANNDKKHGVSDKERRMGMRYSLREHQLTCSKCEIIPFDMTPTNCPVCGNF